VQIGNRLRLEGISTGLDRLWSKLRMNVAAVKVTHAVQFLGGYFQSILEKSAPLMKV
jgi:hypothetical protein